MREVLGHFLAASLLRRGAISLPRVSNVFAEPLGDSYGVIWGSVRCELWVMGAVLPLVGADLRREWSGDTVHTVASETSMDACLLS